MSVHAQVAEGFQSNRRALTTYLTRMVTREDVAEEIVQQTAVRALEQPDLPEEASELRAWLFRVATNLAIDHLRRHGTWREGVLDDTRTRANADAGFIAESHLLKGSAEMKSIAKDHLAVCFACTLRNVSPQESAALLLKEVYDFTVEEVARVMDASFGQVKAWIQGFMAGITAACGATEAMTRSLAAELGPYGVRVNCVRAGGMPFTRTIRETVAAIARTTGVAANDPGSSPANALNRPLTVDETAAMVAFVASDLASGVTGQVLNVCAGSVVSR